MKPSIKARPKPAAIVVINVTLWSIRIHLFSCSGQAYTRQNDFATSRRSRGTRYANSVCTYQAARASAALARVTLARMSEALAVQMKGLGLALWCGDVQVDGQLQFGHAGEAVALDAVLGDVAEEALDHVQPRGAGGREVHDEARMLGQPGLHVGVGVRGVVVHDQMQLQVLGRLAVDQPQELQPLLVPVPRLGTWRSRVPSSVFSAANSVVVPWRLELWRPSATWRRSAHAWPVPEALAPRQRSIRSFGATRMARNLRCGWSLLPKACLRDRRQIRKVFRTSSQCLTTVDVLASGTY